MAGRSCGHRTQGGRLGGDGEMWSAAQRASASPVTLPVPPSDEGRLLKNTGRATPSTPWRACLCVEKSCSLVLFPLRGAGREGTRGRAGLVLNGNGWEDEVRSEDGERGLSFTSLA